jgi:uncharacterized protein YndB with AHSA1/START domain
MINVGLRRRIEAPVERVFAAFADAALVCRWLKPSQEVTLSVLQLDFRAGGHYRFAYYLPGGQRMIVGGTYRQIDPPHRIVFSWLIEPPDEHAGIESEVTVKLERNGGATEIEITHARWDRPDARERHALGWHGALEQLATHIGEWSTT